MEVLEIAEYISLATPYILLCCIIIVIIQYNKIQSNFKVLFYYLVLSLMANLVMELFGYYFNNNLILIPLFGLFELALFTVLYTRYMNLGKLGISVLTIGLLGCGYIIYECLTVNIYDLGEFQSYARAISAFIIVVFSMIYFFDKLSKGTELSDSALKLNTIILVFFSLNLIFLLPMNFLIGKNSYDLKFYFWLAYMSIILLFYIFITISIWKNGKTQGRLRSGLQ
jgi:hypothetical protein